MPDSACDTTLFGDDGGRVYVYMPSVQGKVSYKTLRQKIVSSDFADIHQPSSKYLNGPWAMKVGKRYFLFYAENYADSYWTGVAYTDHPLGLWRNAAVHPRPFVRRPVRYRGRRQRRVWRADGNAGHGSLAQEIGRLSMSSLPVTVREIEEAYAQLQGVIDCTPLQLNPRLSEQFGAEIYLKREDLQIVRSYKIRGAYNLMSSLTEEERAQGVVCASAGNHAQGVAFSCRRLQIQGRIYMPENTPRQKVERVRTLGGAWIATVLVGDTFDDTSRAAAQYARDTQKVFVPPFDDPRIIAGQGTVGIEIAAQMETPPDYLVVPVGGGGLLSGLAVYAAANFPKAHLVGAEPLGAACLYAALQAGHPVTLPTVDTFVDGAAVKTVGETNFAICRELIPEVLRVSEGKVCTEMIGLYQSEGIIAEPAGALGIAALPQLGERLRGKKVVCIVSGGNNDISRYPEVIERSLIDQGLKHYFLVEFSQRPGALRRYLDEALGPNDDITLFEYIKKSNREYGPALVGVELADKNDFKPLLKRMEGIGLSFEVIGRDSALFRFVL